MKRFIVSITMFTLLLVSSSASAQSIGVPVLNSIDVVGQAKIMVEPNLIYLSITINEEDTKGKVSVEELEVNMAKALTKAGVDVKKQLKIVQMSSNMQSLFLRKDEAMTSKSYTLEVYSAKELSKVVTAIENVGLSNVRITQTTHSDLEILRDSVRVMALKNAKKRAELLVKVYDYNLGDAIFISDTERSYMPQSNMILARYGARSSSDSTEEEAPKLQLKEIKIEQSINVTFRFKYGK